MCMYVYEYSLYVCTCCCVRAVSRTQAFTMGCAAKSMHTFSLTVCTLWTDAMFGGFLWVGVGFILCVQVDVKPDWIHLDGTEGTEDFTMSLPQMEKLKVEDTPREETLGALVLCICVWCVYACCVIFVCVCMCRVSMFACDDFPLEEYVDVCLCLCVYMSLCVCVCVLSVCVHASNLSGWDMYSPLCLLMSLSCILRDE